MHNDQETPTSTLYDLGWQQGSLFEAPSIRLCWNDLSKDNGDAVGITQKILESGNQFVVVSQTCDIVRDPEDEPFIEAFLCSQALDEVNLADIERNSPRLFVVDPETRLIAIATSRLQIAKEVLRTLTPIPWPSDEERLARFVRWLGRRYTRPDFPDDVVEAYQQPVINLLRTLSKKERTLLGHFLEAVHEIRLLVRETSGQPFDIQMMLITRNGELSEDEAKAIEEVLKRIRETVKDTRVRLSRNDIIVDPTRLSVADYFSAKPFFLDFYTYKGGEVTGLEPFGPP